MSGGTGNDTYIVDSTSDTVTESLNQGTDLVFSSASFTIFENVENLYLTGSSNIDATGNNDDNIIRGNGGDNNLNGASGDDELFGKQEMIPSTVKMAMISLMAVLVMMRCLEVLAMIPM